MGIASRLEGTQACIQSKQKQLENPKSPLHHLRNQIGNIAGGELGINYDPYMQGNTPYRLFEMNLSGMQKVKCLRMGTPTCQTTRHAPKVTPEFTRFIQIKKEGEHHLYINRQKRSGVEGGRSRVLEGCQNSEAMKALTVVTLAAEGDLYHQKGQYQKDCSFQKLGDCLVECLCGNSEGFYFPEKLKKVLSLRGQALRDFLYQSLEETRKELGISETAILSQAMRRAILFHYLNKNLVEALLNVTEATTYNNTCKDDIDRGGMANAYMYAVYHRPGPEATPEACETYAQNLEGVAFGPAIQVKKRNVIPHRFHDLVNAFNQLDVWNRSVY